MTRIELIQGDITTQAVDAIANAANHRLLGGGGVDGAIHRAAGPRLLAACWALHGCATGEAKITPGFRLPARFVIHTVGPVYRGGTANEADLLAACYHNSLRLADQHQLRSVAFPAISAGIYGYPIHEVAAIALQTVRTYLTTQPTMIELVRFVLFNASAFATFEAASARLTEEDHA